MTRPGTVATAITVMGWAVAFLLANPWSLPW